jgi:hypothetical protein
MAVFAQEHGDVYTTAVMGREACAKNGGAYCKALAELSGRGMNATRGQLTIGG